MHHHPHWASVSYCCPRLSEDPAFHALPLNASGCPRTSLALAIILHTVLGIVDLDSALTVRPRSAWGPQKARGARRVKAVLAWPRVGSRTCISFCFRQAC